MKRIGAGIIAALFASCAQAQEVSGSFSDNTDVPIAKLRNVGQACPPLDSDNLVQVPYFPIQPTISHKIGLIPGLQGMQEAGLSPEDAQGFLAIAGEIRDVEGENAIIHLFYKSGGGDIQVGRSLNDALDAAKKKHIVVSFNAGAVASFAVHPFLNANIRIAVEDSVFVFHPARVTVVGRDGNINIELKDTKRLGYTTEYRQWGFLSSFDRQNLQDNTSLTDECSRIIFQSQRDVYIEDFEALNLGIVHGVITLDEDGKYIVVTKSEFLSLLSPLIDPSIQASPYNGVQVLEK